MKISFVIPAHNESKGLNYCLDSIIKELKKTPAEAELIVVDNASTDNTAEIAGSYKDVIVVHEPVKGLVHARAAGFRRSTGDIIANVDADTILPDGWLRKVLEAFSEDPNLACLSGPFIYYDLPPHVRLATRIFYVCGLGISRLIRMVTGNGGMVQGGNFICRRWALERAGGFDTSIKFYGEDTDIARRLSRVGSVVWTFSLPMLSSGRRLRKEGIAKTGFRYALNFFWVVLFKKPLTRHFTDVRTDDHTNSE